MARGKDVGWYALRVIPSFEGGLGKMNRDLDKAFDGVSKSAGKTLADGVKAGVREAESAIKKSSDKIVALKDREADAVGKVRVAEERLREVRDKGSGGSQLARAEEAYEKALRGQATAANSTAAEIRALARARRDLTAAQKAPAMKVSMPEFDGSGASRFVSGITSEMSGMAGKFTSIGGGAGKGFVAGAAAALLAGGLTAVALKVGADAADMLADGFKSIIDTGIDFEKTMNNFAGVTRATPAEMAKMQAAAKALGADTTLAGVSASSAAAAMTELAKAGFSVDQSIGAARGTMQLATAGQIEAAKAAEIQANAMNAFEMPKGLETAAHVADVFANAAIASSAGIPDLGQALQQVGGIAHGFGVSFDDTIAALGMFANAGVKGSDAGTLLKTTMQSITDQGKPAQGAIEELGLKLYDFDKHQFVGFRELFRQLDEAKRRMNPQEFQAAANVLFGSDAMRSAMLGTVENFDEMATKLQRVGAAGEMANAQMQGLPGAVESFKNTVESIKLDVFEQIGPPLAQGISQFVDYLSQHKSDVIQFFTTVGDAALTMTKYIAASAFGASKTLAGLASVFGLDDLAKSLNFAGDASKEFFDAADSAQDKLALYSNRAQLASKFTDALGKSVSTLKVIGDDVTIDVKDNTPEVREKLRQLGAHLEQLQNDPTTFRIVADTASADNQIGAFRNQQQGNDINIGVGVHYSPGQSFLPEWFKYIGGAAGPAPLPVNPMIGPLGAVPAATPGTIPGTTGASVPSTPPTLGGIPFPPRPRASGGLFGRMPSDAMVQPATPGLVQWAEPSTGGEAFIPLRGGKRSVDIWAETGRQLGVLHYEVGGFRGIDALNNTVQSLSGHKYSTATGDDCSGTQSQLVNAMLGLAPKADRMSTATAAAWLTGKGAILGVGPPGTFRIGWKNGGPGGGHMAGTLPDGTNVEQGGSNNGFTIGGGAAGAMDKQFTDHAYFPLNALFPDGMPSGGVVSPFNGAVIGGSGSGAGGYGGASGGSGGGTYTPATAKQLRDADQKVTDADSRVREVEARKKEAEADGKMKDSERIRLDNELAKAKREADDARADREEVRRGKYKEGTGRGGKSGAGGGDDLSPLGGIFGSFLKETTGLDGSVFPDLSEIGALKMVNAFMGAFGGRQGGDTAAGGAMIAGLPNQQGTGAGFDTGGAASGLPFGMIPAAIDAAGRAAPGMAPPGSPASGFGLGAAPGPIDASRNVSIQVDSGPSAGEIADGVRREVANVDRLHTYVPKGG